jgi:hypothetical protein
LSPWFRRLGSVGLICQPRLSAMPCKLASWQAGRNLPQMLCLWLMLRNFLRI